MFIHPQILVELAELRQRQLNEEARRARSHSRRGSTEHSRRR